MRNTKQTQLMKVLERHKGEEHLIDTWLQLINNQFGGKHKIKNLKSLAQLFSQLKKMGASITKRTIVLGTENSQLQTTFYKYGE